MRKRRIGSGDTTCKGRNKIFPQEKEEELGVMRGEARMEN